MGSIYNELIFRPLYNGLVGIMDIIPGIDLGIAVIIFTVVVKLLLFPLSKSALLTQVRMKEVEPETNKIKKQYANDRQAQALKIMEVYKSRGIKPFSGILLLLIQIPILLALVSVFYKIIPEIHPEFLYSFVSVPMLNTMFLGFIDLTIPSIYLAIATGVFQFLQLKYSLASIQTTPIDKSPSSRSSPEDLASSMNKQMKYIVPLLAFASIYWLIPSQFPQASSIIAVYWMTSSLATFLQELVVRRKYLPKLKAN